MTILPRGAMPWRSQNCRSLKERLGRKRVCSGTWSRGGGDERGVDTTADSTCDVGVGVAGREASVSRYLTMENMFPGNEARVMIVVIPTDAANSAAISFVTIPPVPTLLPGDDTIINL